MASTPGKRAGSRKGAKPARTFRPRLLGLAVGVTLLVVAWGYLVYAAIDFGSSARAGDSTSWWFLALASVGAVACLFAGLVLVARLLRELGVTSAPPPHLSGPPDPPGPGLPSAPATPPGADEARPPGGRRAAR